MRLPRHGALNDDLRRRHRLIRESRTTTAKEKASSVHRFFETLTFVTETAILLQADRPTCSKTTGAIGLIEAQATILAAPAIPFQKVRFVIDSLSI
jgi:hypothetical protein